MAQYFLLDLLRHPNILTIGQPDPRNQVGMWDWHHVGTLQILRVKIDFDGHLLEHEAVAIGLLVEHVPHRSIEHLIIIELPDIDAYFGA